ncbi:MAG TPA: GYD domain-containing protein [Candidatus Dormibacteraeota bacterium]|nr:GYD domain-containing protein [Candidatus Dormibacteraeota bacterium]
MPKYLIEASYSQEGLKGLVKEGGSGRKAAAEAAVKALGGRLESFYFAFGTSDVYGVADMPDNVSAAAFALAVGPTGALAHLKTVVLLTTDEVDQAAKKAGGAGYRPPGH